MSHYYIPNPVAHGVHARKILLGDLDYKSLFGLIVDQHPGISLSELMRLEPIRWRGWSLSQVAGYVSWLCQLGSLHRLTLPRRGAEGAWFIAHDFVERSGLRGWQRCSPFSDPNGLLQVQLGVFVTLGDFYGGDELA